MTTAREPLFRIPNFYPQTVEEHAENWRMLWRMLEDIGSQIELIGALTGLVYGDGSDGDLTFTASDTTASGFISYKEGATTFGQGRDIYASNLIFSNANGNFDWDCQGYRIFVTGTLQIDSGITIHANGRAGNGGTANKANSARGGADPLIGSATGQTAGAGSDGAAAGAGAANVTSRSLSVAGAKATVGGTLTNSGGDGGAAAGGPGTGGGPAGGQASFTPAGGDIRSLGYALLFWSSNSTATQFRGGAGGSGGNTGTSTGGRGGGGGGVLIINAVTLRNSGTLAANGGNGAPGGAAGNAGGGGGGGGGAIVIVSRDNFGIGTTSVVGGTGGAAAGAGKNGANGVDGQAYEVLI